MNWYKKATKDYSPDVKSHAQGVVNANLSYPILITQDGYVIDGMHRAVKAAVLNQPIQAITLSKEELDQTIATPNSTGQTYQMQIGTGKAETYSVDKMHQLFGNKPSTGINPTTAINKNKEGWNGVDVYEVMEQAKQLLHN